MKALTIYQPWASMIAQGRKTIETRTWQTHYRGPLAIHAAKRIDQAACDSVRYKMCGVEIDWPKLLPRSAIVAVAELVDVRPCGQLDREAACCDCDGLWGWVLANVRALRGPVPIAGQRQIWEVPPEVAARVKRELGREGFGVPIAD